MLPWVERPTLTIDLDAPLQQRYVGVPAEAFAAGRQLLVSVMRLIPPVARWLAYLVRLRTWGRFHREAVTLARHAGADWRDVIIANISYDLALAAMGCSTIALATRDGPVVARNMDWWPEDVLARSSYLVRGVRKGVLSLANAGWPGAIGVVTGLSGRGFAVVLNAVRGPEKYSRIGYPVLLHLRRVLEDAPDFKTAVAWLSRQRLTTPCLLTVVGSDNHERVVIERTPTRFAQRWPKGDEPLITTNDYRLLFPPAARGEGEIYETACSRFDALCEFFAAHDAGRDVDDLALLYILSDVRVMQTITAQHIIMRPRARWIRLFVPTRVLEDGYQSEMAAYGSYTHS